MAAGDEGEKVRRAMAGLGEALRRAMKQTLDADGERWTTRIAGSVRGPLVLGPGKSVSADLATRSGMLRRSFVWNVSRTEQLDGMSLQKATTSPYALIHEFGGIIRPRNAKMLAIPLPKAMTPSGVPRMPGPRAWGRQIFLLRIHGKYFLARRPPKAPKRESYDSAHSKLLGLAKRKRKRKTPKLELLYVLKDRVILTPRLKMRELHEADSQRRIDDFGVFARAQLARLARGRG